MKKVAVSIHAKEDFSIDILANLEGYDYIHIDVMDGIFVPVSNLNLKIFKLIHSNYSTPIIAHLMVKNPLQYIESIIDDIQVFLFHFEVSGDKNLIINTIKNLGKQVGLVINPYTPIEEIKDFLSHIDIILVLGVEPGWSGQKMNENVISKINRLAEWKKHNKNYTYQIDVDGGVNLKTAFLLKNADILTSASFILNSSKPNEIMKKLKSI